MNARNLLGPVGGFILALAVKLSPLGGIPFIWVLTGMGVKYPGLCWVAISDASSLKLADYCDPVRNAAGIINLLTIIMFVALVIVGWFGVRELISKLS